MPEEKKKNLDRHTTLLRVKNHSLDAAFPQPRVLSLLCTVRCQGRSAGSWVCSAIPCVALGNALNFFRAFVFYRVQPRMNTSLSRVINELQSTLMSSEGECWPREAAVTAGGRCKSHPARDTAGT